jgi:hypothetical protein
MTSYLIPFGSYLSRHLDRIPFLADTLNPDIWPRMRLLPSGVDIDSTSSDVPDVFTERILRARLAQFWRCNRLPRGPEWDMMAAEERYEQFCSSFLQDLPPAFALEPDRQWDERLPALPMQRQLLHIAIFEQLCWNFRPTLLQQPDQMAAPLPLYKQVMLAHGKRALAAAALSLLQCAKALHGLMTCGSLTQFSGIIVPIFEAAVPLLCLCADRDFPGITIQHGCPAPPQHGSSNPLEARIAKVTRDECVQAARDALSTLENLAEVSEVAEIGARTIARLISRFDADSPTTLSLAHQPAYQHPEFENVDGGAAGTDVGAGVASISTCTGPAGWRLGPMRDCVVSTEGAEEGTELDFPFDGGCYSGVGSGWADLLGDLTDSLGV